MKSILCSTAVLTSLLFLSFSQPIQNDPVIIEIEDLTPELFKIYMLLSLENDEIEIIEACVPAQLISVNLVGVFDNDEDAILNFFSSPENSGDVKVLNDFTMADFTNKCHQARLGK